MVSKKEAERIMRKMFSKEDVDRFFGKGKFKSDITFVEPKGIDEKVDDIMENITEDENLCVIRQALYHYFKDKKLKKVI